MRILIVNRNLELVNRFAAVVENAGHVVLHSNFVCFIRYKDMTFAQPAASLHARSSYDELDLVFCSAPVASYFLNYLRGPSILREKLTERGRHAVGLINTADDRIALEAQGFNQFIDALTMRAITSPDAFEAFLQRLSCPHESGQCNDVSTSSGSL